MSGMISPGARRYLGWLLPACTHPAPQYRPRDIDTRPETVEDTHASGNYPRISVVVPSLNQGRFIGQTLKSLIEQNYPNLELLVVDGGSDDDTLHVIGRYEQHIAWWVSEPDAGQAQAINKGMGRATGEILAWLNSDDCLMPGALHRVAQALLSSPAVDVVYGHRVLIDEAGRDVGRWIVPRHSDSAFYYADFIPQETMFWRRSAWEACGGCVDESLNFALDWDLIRRFIGAGAKFERIPAFLGQFRLHSEQKTVAEIGSQGFSEMERVRREFRGSYSGNVLARRLYRPFRIGGLGWFLLRARFTELLWRAGLISIP